MTVVVLPKMIVSAVLVVDGLLRPMQVMSVGVPAVKPEEVRCRVTATARPCRVERRGATGSVHLAELAGPRPGRGRWREVSSLPLNVLVEVKKMRT